MFIDTHCHFDFPPFAGNETTSLELAGQMGLEKIIVPTVSRMHFQRVALLAEAYPAIYAAFGLHPLYIREHQNVHVDELNQQLQKKCAKCVAIGEIGLDLYMPEPQFDMQKSILEAQLTLAKQYDLPVILHSRKSHDQLAAILRKQKLPRTGVIHGFSGSLSQAQAFIRMGFYIGVGGTITYDRAQKTRNTIAQLPLASLVLETDAPDMPLSGFQGQPNRPERVAQVFSVLCELRQESSDEIASQVYENSVTLFTLG
ncbi:TatD family hydrolase [Xenorhabdus nematophila]|uniref:TatD family hydrolase n=1 Tax=Xenorhabdus nematophila TaxID=628 RepID=UPI0005435D9B|nr:TatD family hydrolase [Xenorhabdus nematophila]CEF28769.1 putative hydrolase with metallo-dependent hydrolase domain [Xenorhabdus nematophila str. Websteri]AYA42305.1 metal-dependent hydrolase [Xenorhabdus nematophila]KHD29226.1 deoxyribonuclease YjjV [Xenorhabdus nematophila]MBA0021034.1 TatD family hydrolase [Xenorhabdus nematophila]MCB4424874.1 metal-dependent hydrolase [Xenorhabdus nematophila]